MVFGWDIKQIVKKKYSASTKDKRDWSAFIRQMENIRTKEADLLSQKTEIDKVKKLDLHGFSLNKSNEMVKQFIIESFDFGYRKLLIVTGKGQRSKSYDNPYVSEKLSVLRYSVPEFIKNNENLNNKISRISSADVKDGGEGAIYIFLKKNKNFTE